MAVYRHAFGIVEDEVPCGSIGGVSVDGRKENGGLLTVYRSGTIR